MLLAGEPHHEGGDVNELFSNSNMSLSDHDSGVMHGGGQLSLGDQGLESSLHELVDGESENVIELSLVLLEEAELDYSADDGVSFELSSGIIFGKGEKSSGGLSQFGEGKLDSPDFSLVLKAVSSDDSQFVHKSLSIERLSWGLGSSSIIGISLWHVHYGLLYSTQ